MEETIQSVWQKSKLLVKGLMIGVLILLLMIPAHFVQNIIEEREQRQQDAVIEVSSKWAGAQVITGPILVVPYWVKGYDTTKKEDASKHYAYILPDQLTIDANMNPEEKHRGIYKVMLYSSGTTITGSFESINLASLKISQEDIIWEESFVKLHLSDSKGLNSNIQLKWNDSLVTLSPSVSDEPDADGSLAATVPLTGATGPVRFSTTIDVNGSQQFLFTPTGKTTEVKIRSTWKHPSFAGNSLPQSSEVNDSGFSATWKSVAHKRNFPQQWKDQAYKVGTYTAPSKISSSADNYRTILPDYATSPSANHLTTHAFGTDLFIPVNGYQKTMRSVKYAILCILLTFTAFFLIETTNRKAVHPVQYALIGFALILFYTLLLSISEYTGFNTAYGIASLATVSLIAWFVKGLLGSGRLSLLLSVILVLLYGYVFTILQLQDYALLLGSIGLFLTLAIVMYYSRKIHW